MVSPPPPRGAPGGFGLKVGLKGGLKGRGLNQTPLVLTPFEPLRIGPASRLGKMAWVDSDVVLHCDLDKMAETVCQIANIHNHHRCRIATPQQSNDTITSYGSITVCFDPQFSFFLNNISVVARILFAHGCFSFQKKARRNRPLHSLNT